MPLPLMATVKDTTCQGGEMERIYDKKNNNKVQAREKFCIKVPGALNDEKKSFIRILNC